MIRIDSDSDSDSGRVDVDDLCVEAVVQMIIQIGSATWNCWCLIMIKARVNG